MTLSNCHGECHRDPDTGDIFCPCVPDGWVTECPKEEVINAEWFGEGEVNKD